MSNLDLLNSLLFEVLERIAIFHLHLQETDKRFFLSRSSHSSEPHLVDSFKECLSRTLHCVVAVMESIKKSDDDQEKVTKAFLQIMELISVINKLHKTHLGNLPRPPEPPELKRFGRILQKHALKIENPAGKENLSYSDISIYLSEETTEEIFAGDPLEVYKQDTLNKIVYKINSLFNKHDFGDVKSFARQAHENLGYHLTVPRIDATNPCRWPTLVHEVGHRIMKPEFFFHDDIKEDFIKALSNDGIKLPEEKIESKKLRSWLTECWCDLFGAIVIGPSFWFAQWSSFLFNWDATIMSVGSNSHPPALFRLHLIRGVLRHRFPEVISPEFRRTAREAKLLLEEFDTQFVYGFTNNHDLKELALLFRDYFFRHIFKKGAAGKLVMDATTLNDNLSTIIKYTERINATTIEKMVGSLANGLPIPAVTVSEPARWYEKASTVQEILLSAWIYRNTTFQNTVLNKYNEIIIKYRDVPDKIWDYYVDDIVKMFSEFNFSVLRSIQVSEWVDLFDLNKQIVEETEEKAKKHVVEDTHTSVLVDYQILNLIKSKDIQVIPIINIEKQLGSSSLDIRLGTSFQIYYPNQVGVVDVTDDNSVESANVNSSLVDLDFLDWITIAPGQFILGHSMEYICLSSTVAAQVDGRSSFARLGIEVHMTAGFVDPGFQGVLTFEIYNAGPNPVRLYPGLRIGQLRFFKGSSPSQPYNKNTSAKYRGLLQHHSSLQFKDYEVMLLKTAIKKKGQQYEC